MTALPLQVLLEVAQALQHLHQHGLIHGDVKPENVLLKADSGRRCGFVTKLSDFGLVKMLRDSYYVVNRSGAGTLSFLAPEQFTAGSKVTVKVDSYAFGVMMWEVYCARRAYGGMERWVDSWIN